MLQTWEDPHLVTITAKSVPLSRIAKRMRSLINGFQKITEKYRKRAQRGTGKKLMGIKSLESNFNPIKKTYNPHFHLIVANREMAEIIKREWLTMCPEHLARPKAQKIDRIWNKEKALIEVVKYGSKIFTEPDVNDKLSKNQDREIYASALDNIFTAMQGIRIFERFGFNLPKAERWGKSRVVKDVYEWRFEPQVFDWINEFTDATLSGYVPPAELVNLLTYNIDKSLE